MARKAQLISTTGQPEFGYFPDGVETINYLDYDLRNAMDKRLGAFAKRFKFNQFQFIGFTSPALLLGVAIVDLKWVSNAFVYCYDVQTQQFEEFSFIQPLARNTRIDTQPGQGKAFFRKGANYLSIDASSQPGRRLVEVQLKQLRLTACIDENTAYQPLALCTRAGYQGWVFTQKAAALNCSGQLNWRNRPYDLQALKTLACVDWTAGYMRRETFWNWGSLSCFLPDGRRLGFNSAAGVNETGFTENVLWLDGRFIKIDMVDFQFDRYDPNKAWSMTSNDGIIRLQFEPQGLRQEKINAGLIASNFTQHFGRYYGEVHLPDEVIPLEGAWGFSEDHYAKW
ncbi:DUF2804 domain-containing protein [Alkalimonas amylolytica]|uniref:DUF2804 domain-containing protein n=1 Tax=Alkalimonas amylolytica TaxID=152573 RepID=A0A1H3ZDQ2_ALKAM|nr:DUF2804 domain-containing protein [Alkalimonas amylolytica]SEA21452.1 Protein of unknown function [Alkalimonas amylolytica]